MSAVDVELATIQADARAQTRAALCPDTVAEYSEALAGGASFPPVVVFEIGEQRWLADGFHRHAAYLEAERTTIPADVRAGSLRDAILYSVGANADHGLRRTNADKRRAVEMLLGDAEWSQLSDRELARRARVTHPFVSKVRRSLVTVTTPTLADAEARVAEVDAHVARLDALRSELDDDELDLEALVALDREARTIQGDAIECQLRAERALGALLARTTAPVPDIPVAHGVEDGFPDSGCWVQLCESELRPAHYWLAFWWMPAPNEHVRSREPVWSSDVAEWLVSNGVPLERLTWKAPPEGEALPLVELTHAEGDAMRWGS